MTDALYSLVQSGWFTRCFAAVSLGSTLVIIVIILSENRNPVKSLAWVTVLLLLPVVGLILYVFFGRNIKNTRMISRRNRRRLKRAEREVYVDPRDSGLDAQSIALATLGRSASGALLYPSNSVNIFNEGGEMIDALLADIDAANHSVHLQFYIFSNDTTGRRVAEALCRAVSRGVSVRLIYDHVGSFSVGRKFFKELRAAGVEAYPFFKVSFPLLGTRVNWRNHRKICIIDGIAAYIGGMNVANRYVDGGRAGYWRDAHLRIVGPVVSALQYSFAVDWNFMGRGLIDTDSHISSALPSLAENAIKDVEMQLLTSGPTTQWSSISMTFLKAIAAAKRRVYITTPYFLPNEALLKALQAAALAHVDVRIMVPGHSDSAMLDYASGSYFAECMRAGIKIYRYNRGMLHSKVMIVDDDIVSVGSSNFDFRSFDYNFEANVMCYSKEMNAAMTAVFRDDIAHCDRIQPTQWRRRPTTSRIAESALRLLSPVL